MNVRFARSTFFGALLGLLIGGAGSSLAEKHGLHVTSWAMLLGSFLLGATAGASYARVRFWQPPGAGLVEAQQPLVAVPADDADVQMLQPPQAV